MMRHALCALSVGLLLTDVASAQDLQPGRNFPTSQAAFGQGRSENIDVGDIDTDGDLDVLVANGGDGAAQQNRIYVNDGGAQPGTPGTFADGTATRYPSIADTSRDCEFADVDDDGDLDIYISNRGGGINGEVSRFFDNNGSGFFSETTNTRWGALVSVPLSDQVFGGNAGPWRDWSCDCDFGDVDLDGTLDLFHSSYGPSISGNKDSRVFLNDGTGVFDELFPWIDSGADIKLHTLDIDLTDFDDDFDLDIFASSRDSQARFYTNNTAGAVGTELYTDTTSPSLLEQGVSQVGNNNYEAEYADLDADGDFDVWIKNFVGGGFFGGLGDVIATNNGVSGGVTRFSEATGAIVNDPEVDENEVDFLDYDSDGDLDAFAGNFSGTNWLYRSTIAQGGSTYNRTGAGGEPAELPSTGNGGTTLDGEAGDLDNDGDPDLMLAQDNNAVNRLFLNELGVPDTTAPTFHQVEAVADKPVGDDARVIAQLRDNSAYYIIGLYDTDLIFTVDGGPEQTVDMTSQGGQQFVGFIPGDLEGTIEYRVETSDRAGNTGVSSTQSFVQGNAGAGFWTDLGFPLAGTNGLPVAVGTGPLTSGSANQVDLANALGNASTTLVASIVNLSVPFKGGTLVPKPDFLIPLVTSGAGAVTLPFTWPAGIPAGTELFWQFWIQDPGGPNGFAASNALKSTSGT